MYIMDQLLTSMLKNNKSMGKYKNIIKDMFPFIKECIPDEYKSKNIAQILLEFLNMEAYSKIEEFLRFVVFESPDISYLKSFTSLCELIADPKSKKQVKELIICLSLSSTDILEKQIDFKVAGIDFTKTIKNLKDAGYSPPHIDMLLQNLKKLIQNLLKKELADIELSDIKAFFQPYDNAC